MSTSRSAPKHQLHGWMNLDKPYDMGSTEAVSAIKRLLCPTKIGHAGTLDPLATGILPLALGEATKTSAYMMDAIKEYYFTICFGEQRDTDDAEGNVIATSLHRPTDTDLKNIIPNYIGVIQQTPPIYSALKINGQRAYDLARAGQKVTVKPREVCIYNIAMIERTDDHHASFTVTCGKGTYVRSLARDISVACNTVGHVSELRRTRVGAFTENNAISLDDVKKYATLHSPDKYQALLQPIECGLDDIPAVSLDHAQAAQLRHGQGIMVAEHMFSDISEASEVYQAKCGNQLIALVRRNARHIAPLRVFNL